MKPAEPKTTIEAPIFLAAGESTALRELVDAHRAALANATTNDERGRLHLKIGAYLGALGADSRGEAIEEFRQALAFVADANTFDQAVIRLRLGGLLQEQAMAYAMADRIPAARAAGEESLYLLELAYGALVRAGSVLPRIEATRRYAHALSFRGRFDDMYALLEREQRELAGDHRRWIELYLADHAFADPDRKRHAQGARILASSFSEDNGIPTGADDFIVYLIGTALPHLPDSVARLALEWSERQEDVSVALLASLRSKVYPHEPERWMSKDDQEKLIHAMDDERRAIATRADAAYHLLSLLPNDDILTRRRAVELLETWVDSPDVHPIKRSTCRHDLGVAMRILVKDDPKWLERAARQLQNAHQELRGTPAQPIVARNLLWTLLELLDARSKVSSPRLVDLAASIDIVSADLPIEEAREFQLSAATALLHLDLFSHPVCVKAAGLLIEEVLKKRPNDADAHRLRYWHARIRHDQGFVDARHVERLLEHARKLGPVAEHKPTEEHERVAARAFAENGSFESVDLQFAVGGLRVRPDVTAAILDEVQHRLDMQGLTLTEKSEILDYAITALDIAPAIDEHTLGKKFAAILLQNKSWIRAADIARMSRRLRGPIGEIIHDALQNEAFFGIETGAADVSNEERAQSLYDQGVRLIDQGQARLLERDRAGATPLFEEARNFLDEARRIGQELDIALRVAIHISAGNSRRWLARVKPKEKLSYLDEADKLFVEAWPWTAKQLPLRAQLAKVRADGLFARKDASRWDEVMGLYRIALDGRPSGFKRFETLHAVAKAELVCPNRSHEANALAALSRLDEALQHVSNDDTSRSGATAQFMLSILHQLKGDIRDIRPQVSHFAARIIQVVPNLESDVRMALEGLDGMNGLLINEGISIIGIELLESDFWQAYLSAVAAALPPRGPENLPPHMRELISEADVPAPWERRGGDVMALRDAATVLSTAVADENAEKRAGRLVARARVMHKLQEVGEDVHGARIVACAEAEAAARAITRNGIRGQALVEVACAWQIIGPNGDFVKSFQLLDEALSLLPDEWKVARSDALAIRARAIRYREDLPVGEALEKAIPAYREAEALYQATGNAEGLAQTLKNLAEALCGREDRPRAEALREGIAVAREAIRIARHARVAGLPEYLHNCAYSLLLLAQCSGITPEDYEEYMQESKLLFDEAARLNTDPALGRMIENNRLNWLAYAAKQGDGKDLIAALRGRLKSIDPLALPLDWAMAAHNLGNELFERCESDGDLKEAYTLLEKALALRPLHAGPQFHWETASRYGQLLGYIHGLGLRKQIDLRSFGHTLLTARARAFELFRFAMVAARQMGQGRAIMRTVRFMGLLSVDVSPGKMPDLAIAGEALAALDDVLALMPEAQDAGEVEAEVATAISASLALHRAETAVVKGVTSTGATVLHGSAAWEVLHWMLRAHGGRHRRLRARMTRPNGVSPERWTRWRQALRNQNNWDERRNAFRAIREECGSFLSGEPDLSATLDWIKSSGGSAAMLLETTHGWLLGVISPRDHAGVDAWVVLLDAKSPPFSLNEFLTLTRSPVTGGGSDEAIAKAQKALEDAVKWLRSNVLPDLRERVPTNIPALLWSPHGLAAGVPLGIVWSDLPSIWTTPCLTRPPPSIEKDVRQSTLLVLAEPAGVPPIVDGAETMARIAQGIRDSGGQVQALFGKGRTTGPAIAGMHDVPGLVDVAPTPNEVKRRLPDHRLIVILAHGQYNDAVPEKSALALIGPNGQMELLTAEALAETPDLLRGAVVVLLSCETGAAGELSAAPAGLAGVLLAVGAAAVVAPLWIVLQRVALRVGEQLAADIAYGYELGKAVQWAQDRARKGVKPFDEGPFVLWTG